VSGTTVREVEVACPACGTALLARPLERRRCARCEAPFALAAGDVLAVRGREPVVSRLEAEQAFARQPLGIRVSMGAPKPSRA